MDEPLPVARGFYTPDLGERGSFWIAKARAEVEPPEKNDLHGFIDRLLAWFRGVVGHGASPVHPAQPAEVFDIGTGTARPLCYAFVWLCMEGFGEYGETVTLRHSDNHHVHDVVLVGNGRIVVDPSFKLNHGLSLEALRASPDKAKPAEGWNGYNGENTSGFFRGTIVLNAPAPEAGWGWVG